MIGLLVASALASAAPASAQVTLSADVGLNSQFVWRGVTSTNRFVIEPELTLAVPLRGSTLTLGAWGNVEPVRYDAARDISSLGGLPGPLITQSDLWAELGRSMRGVDAAVGAHRYLYPRVGDLARYNTVELYASASAEGFLSPSVDVAYDVARIRGAYVEAGVSRGITGDRLGAVTVGLLAGFSAGMATDPSDRDLAYFDRDGVTHIDASATASFSIGRITVTPEAHFIFARDALATVVEPDATRRTKLWFGSTLHWTSERAEGEGRRR
jgi:hypothetical protein